MMRCSNILLLKRKNVPGFQAKVPICRLSLKKTQCELTENRHFVEKTQLRSAVGGNANLPNRTCFTRLRVYAWSKVRFGGSFIYVYVFFWMQLFCLQLEASCLQWSFFHLQLTIFAFLLAILAFFAYNFSFRAYNWSFFAYGEKVRLIRALRDCKQRSLTVSKKAPPVSKKSFPRFFFFRHFQL